MKKTTSKRTIKRSIISVVILALFVFFGLGSNLLFELIGVPIGVTTEYSKEKDEYTQMILGLEGEGTDSIWSHTTRGHKNLHGQWSGGISITNRNTKTTSTGRIVRSSMENVYILNGRRDGMSITYHYKKFVSEINSADNFYYSQRYDTVCYDNGNVIPCDQLKSTSITEESPSGYQILETNYPWFLISLNVMGIENEYVQSYMDTIEVLLNAESFDVSKLDSRYDDAIEILEETRYDSLTLMNSLATSVYGKELLKDLEFRMAVIDQQRENDKGTFHFLQDKYPHFLTSFDSESTIVKDSEWENFCSKFDNVMDTFPQLDISDPFFVDSIDSRIYSTLAFIADEEEDTTKSVTIKSILKQAISSKKKISLSSLLEEHKTNLFLHPNEDILPQAFATAILIRMARKYVFEGDVPRLAIKEAYFLQQNIVQVPTLTTHLAASQSSSSATIEGYIIKDGGAEITDKGIVFATFLNPTTKDSIIKPQLAESFAITIDNLIEGETYYVRSYATNSAGTAYGNNISFLAGSSVGLNQNKLINSDFNVYPNPTNGSCIIQYHVSQSSNCDIQIFDIHGKQVAQPLSEFQVAGIHQINFDYKNLSNGIYLIKFTNNNQSFTVKSILNK